MRNPMKSLTKSESIVSIVKLGKNTLFRYIKGERHILLYLLYLLYFYILLLVIRGL